MKKKGNKQGGLASFEDWSQSSLFEVSLSRIPNFTILSCFQEFSRNMVAFFPPKTRP